MSLCVYSPVALSSSHILVVFSVFVLPVLFVSLPSCVYDVQFFFICLISQISVICVPTCGLFPLTSVCIYRLSLFLVTFSVQINLTLQHWKNMA